MPAEGAFRRRHRTSVPGAVFFSFASAQLIKRQGKIIAASLKFADRLPLPVMKSVKIFQKYFS